MTATPSLSEATTEDSLLHGAVRLRQPAHGYRVAIDPVFLAAAVPAKPGQRALDAGTGTGAAALCLAYRVPGIAVAGIERQVAMARLARQNVALNGLEGAIDIVDGDFRALANGRAYDHVMANPPYREAGRANRSPDRARATATIEDHGTLAEWIDAAFGCVRAAGTVTFMHAADRGAEVIAHMAAYGSVDFFPLLPKAGRQPKRVLVRGTRGAGSTVRRHAGLVLHEADGRYTPEAQAVLRQGEALAF